jgi:hypothetical protein
MHVDLHVTFHCWSLEPSGCSAVQSRWKGPTFQGCVLPPSTRRWINWWWRQYAPLKRRSTSTWLHEPTSQMTLNFILAAVRTWYLTCPLLSDHFQNFNISTSLIKFPNINFYKNPFIVCRVVNADRQTDIVKLIYDFFKRLIVYVTRNQSRLSNNTGSHINS